MQENPEKVRKSISPEQKAKLKATTKYMWITCAECDCEFEVTQSRGLKGPRVCIDCFTDEFLKQAEGSNGLQGDSRKVDQNEVLYIGS